METPKKTRYIPRSMRKATLAGGCFWCTEAAYKELNGVQQIKSGYAGGKEETANYEDVSTGKTNHREAVQVTYDEDKTSYKEILETYWRNIDPTDPDGQFADKGPQYTTAIYVHNSEQRRIAERTKKDLEESERFQDPVVTQIEEYTTFFPAETHHQRYAEKNPSHYKLYKQASGRESFKRRVWKQDA